MHPDRATAASPHPDRATAASPHPDRAAAASTHPDRATATLADRQHGVVASWQLDLPRHTIRYRGRVGRLHRIHKGVYAVGRRKLTREGHWMAAVLAYGPRAVLSHRSAGALWGITSGGAKIDVTTAGAHHSRPGIRAHRAPLHREDITRRDRIPVTSLARTILDLAATLEADRLTRAIEDADRLQLLDMRKLDRAMARRPRARGIAKLRAVLGEYRGAGDTRSPLEQDFLTLVRRAGLPDPTLNALVEGFLVDAHWPRWRLVVELDGRSFHASPRAFENDRVRDTILQKHGWRVMRVTRKRLTAQPQQVIADLNELRQLPASPPAARRPP